MILKAGNWGSLDTTLGTTALGCFLLETFVAVYSPGSKVI